MIIDHLSQAARYQMLVSGLKLGFDFLHRNDLLSLADGKHVIDDERVFAIVAHDQGRGKPESPLEFHARYIDIQYVIGGTDLIGWRSTPSCQQVLSKYDRDKDIGFFKEEPRTWFPLDAGNFAIFFPDDAHAPLAGEGTVHKVVVKVAVAEYAN